MVRSNKIGGIFDSYKDYLESNWWQSKRNDYLNYRDNKCEICGKKAIQVHHKTYERVCNEKIKDLLAVCKKCHNKIHKK